MAEASGSKKFLKPKICSLITHNNLAMGGCIHDGTTNGTVEGLATSGF